MDYLKRNEKLSELPLFLGMSIYDIEKIVMSAKIKYRDFQKGKTVAKENEPCENLYILIEGIMTATGRADDNGYCITEKLSAPDIIQPERIFGLAQRYTREFKAHTDCRFLCLGKQEVMHLSDNYEIFRLNLLNIICTCSQRLARQPWRTQPSNIRKKIARFIEKRCLRPAGEKTIHVKMQRLSEEISESRLNVSRVLNALKNEGIISLKRGEIHIQALEKLITSGN